MKEKLLALLEKSYSPYSNFSVACILEAHDETLFTGVNIENASYGATICAERIAILDAVKKGYRKGEFKSINIMAGDQSEVLPCFICRQVMTEFFDGTETLNIYYQDRITIIPVKDLIPYPFKLEQDNA